MLNENDVETCCLLERLRSAKDHISFTLDMEDYYRIKDKEKKMYYVTIDQARVITGTNLSNKAIAEYMNIEDLIEVGNDGKTKKAFKKEGCDKRFLCIYKKAIKDYYKRTHHADE